MLTLLELHKACPEVFDRLEVYVDGGFSRGTDILKALALGATAVGLGRPYLYALTYGQEGVEHMTEILKDELESSLKLSGITDVDEAHPGMVNTSALEPLIRSQEQHPWIAWRSKSKL
jgi:L-lactate dehydrogenase (cytochrome)